MHCDEWIKINLTEKIKKKVWNTCSKISHLAGGKNWDIYTLCPSDRGQVLFWVVNFFAHFTCPSSRRSCLMRKALRHRLASGSYLEHREIVKSKAADSVHSNTFIPNILMFNYSWLFCPQNKDWTHITDLQLLSCFVFVFLSNQSLCLKNSL